MAEVTDARVVLVVAPEGFADDELETPRGKLEEAGVETLVASTEAGTCRGADGTAVDADLAFADVEADDVDGVLVVGGPGAADHLWGDETLRELVRALDDRGAVVCAIGLGSPVLAKAGVLDGHKAATAKDDRAIQALRDGGALYMSKILEAEDGGRLVTADGPTAGGMLVKRMVKALDG